MVLLEWVNTEIFKVIGWTIIHSFWQSAILFAILKLFLLVINKKRSELRYFFALITLVAITVCSVITFLYEYKLHMTSNLPSVVDTGNHVNNVSSANVSSAQVISDTTVNNPSTAPTSFFLNFLNIISAYLTFGWLLGILFYASKILFTGFYLKNLRKLPTDAYPPAHLKVAELSAKMRIDRFVKLIITNKVSEPLTFGTFKPVILLPFSYVLQVPIDHLEMIIAHELSHIKRYDYLVNLLQSSLEALYFYNPFFQNISSIVRNEREYCCDDMAAGYCGNKHVMAIALTNLKFFTKSPGLSLSAAPTKNTFRERIRRLAYPTERSAFSMKNSLANFVIIALTMGLLTKCAYDHNEDANRSFLPGKGDSLEQLLTDHQANHKIDVFSYEKENKQHEIFLVSTDAGKPLYGYLDGSSLPDEDIATIYSVIQQKRTISLEEMANRIPSNAEVRTLRMNQLNIEIDSLTKLIDAAKSKLRSNPSVELKNRLDSLRKQYSVRTGETVTLSMENYKEEAKKIPADVQLHELLTKIITSKEYNQQQRARLNELIKQKRS